MNDTNYDAVMFDGEVFCVHCLPDDVSMLDRDVHPLFANSKHEKPPTCIECGWEHYTDEE